MSIRSTLAFALPVLLALSACGDETEITVEDDGREASGEVLEGSISDEMIALDKVRSQAPLAEPEASEGGTESGTGGGTGGGAEGAEEPEVEAVDAESADIETTANETE